MTALRVSIALVVFAFATGLGGCSTTSQSPVISEESFFPAPPDLPRVQFLRSFNGSPDFEQRSEFLDYLAGAKPAPKYEIVKPFSVATWRGRIYVTDSRGLKGVNVFDLENERFFVVGKSPGGLMLKKPIHIFVDDEGFKYVSDLDRYQVVVYGPDDEYVRVYGNGSSFRPVACVADSDNVYILDIKKDTVDPSEATPEFDEIRRDQILVLDRASGKPLRRIGRHGSDRQGFSFASFLARDPAGNLYVSDFMNHRVVKLDPGGNVLAEFGRQGDRAGDFAQMKGVAVDRQGLIYVVDAAFQAVQAFDNAGMPLFAMGGPRAPAGPMDLPAGICIDYHNVDYFRDLCHPDFEPEYLIIVANQLSPRHRVAVYAYGRRKGVEYPESTGVTSLDNTGNKVLWTLPTLPATPSSPPAAPEPSGT